MNKCIFKGSTTGANGYYIYGYDSLDNTPLTVITNTYFKQMGQIFNSDLGKISISKCSYDIWSPVSCFGSLAIDDKAIEPTLNYGPLYGTPRLLIRIEGY